MDVNLHHVSLTVTDVEASVAWYSDVFGFVELARADHHGAAEGSAVLIGKPDWSMAMGLSCHPTNGGEVFDPTRTGLDHVGFTVADRDTLVEWEALLADKGVRSSPIVDEQWGCSLNFRDRDDVQLRLLAFA